VSDFHYQPSCVKIHADIYNAEIKKAKVLEKQTDRLEAENKILGAIAVNVLSKAPTSSSMVWLREETIKSLEQIKELENG